MRRLITALLALACATAAGCASKADVDARYQASLLRWRDASRAQLEAAWGRPTLVQEAPDGQVLTWIVRVDIDDRETRGTAPEVVVTRAQGNSGATATSVTPSALAPATVPITCTTHFVLKDGRVASWTFEGLGCGAPT